MVEFHVFGGIELRDSAGVALDDLLRHPKRVALLLYLTLADPPRLHRRDTLLALFSPDIDAEHARGALRKSLFVLREALGPDVIIIRGDDEVGVNRAHLNCDAWAFMAALAEGHLAEALALYRGDLAVGFHVRGMSPNWEPWLEARRVELRRRAVDAAWTQSAALLLAGDVAEGVRWARWASDRAPDDERGIRRLLDLLGGMGDRAGVMQVYEEFRRRLRTEHDVAPDPETQALVVASGARTARLSPAPLTDDLRSRWDRLVQEVVAELTANHIDPAVLRASFERRTLSFPGSSARGRWSIEITDADLLQPDVAGFAKDIVREHRRDRDRQ